MSRDQIIGVTPDPVYACCHCCGVPLTDDPDVTYWQAHCTARDQHATRCVLCAQPPAVV